MCGIFGYVGSENFDIKKATDAITHRGPDSEGFLQYVPSLNKVNKESKIFGSKFGISYGFRRLQIIDLKEKSNQPFSDLSQDYHLIFNGEIYNYIELREELIKLGYKFLTKSDTEVLLTSYIEWGNACFEKFNGMWAVSILDIKAKKVICCRDRFGIKPLFYNINTDKNSVYFASEIKQFFEVGVVKEINENVIRDFIDTAILDSTNETFFKGIYHLPAASLMEIDFQDQKKININISKFWNLEIDEKYSKFNYAEARAKMKELFNDSVKLRFRSDVPIGSCLSGGLDSSSIVVSAASQFDFKINTFTSKFDIKKFDESNYVENIADKYHNVNVNYCQLTEDIFLSEIDKVIYHQDEPFGSMSLLAQWEVMKLAKNKGVKVLLDGQGGDELLAGYRKFYAFYLKEKLLDFSFIKFFKAIFYLLKSKEFNFFDREGIERYLGVKSSVNYFSEKGKTLTSKSTISFKNSSSLQERSKLDIEKYSYPQLLRYEDRDSMAFSIETRVPFMDYRLVEFLYSISSDFKIRKGFTKAVLRDALKGMLPIEIQKRKSKLGFSTPQDIWMNDKLRTYFEKYFNEMKNPYLDSKEIYASFKTYPSNKVSSDLFFRIYCFDNWYQKHF